MKKTTAPVTVFAAPKWRPTTIEGMSQLALALPREWHEKTLAMHEALHSDTKFPTGNPLQLRLLRDNSTVVLCLTKKYGNHFLTYRTFERRSVKVATNLQNRQINVFPRRNAESYIMVSEATINNLRDRVGNQRGASTKPRKEAVSTAFLSSGDAPVKRQQIGQQDEPAAYVNLAERGAPRQRDGSKEPPS